MMTISIEKNNKILCMINCCYKNGTWRVITMAFLISAATGFILLFGYTFFCQPLFLFKFDSLDWRCLLLGTTVVDYHVTALCLAL